MAFLTACSKNVNHKIEYDTVKIWWYEQEGNTYYNHIMENVIDKITSYAKLNDIKIDIQKYSYADYVLKRNAAVSYGDVNIIFDTADNLYQLKEKAGSYDKIKNYENLFDNLKNQYCIPLCIDMRVNFVNNYVLKSYNIEPENAITLDEYYEIKQSMKELGAEFKLNFMEFEELVDYYCRKNNVQVVIEEGKLNIDKEAILTTVHELVDDIKNNYDYANFISEIEKTVKNEPEDKIIEKKSGYDFSYFMGYYIALNYEEYNRTKPSIENCTMVIVDNNRYKFTVPCAFIPENNKNEVAYSIVDTLLSDGFQNIVYDCCMGIITNSEKTKKLIGFDENWNYVGIRNLADVNGNKVAKKIYPKKEEDKLYELLTKGYEIIRDRDMTDFFTDSKYYWTLNEFVSCMTIDAIKDNKKFDVIVK